MSGLLRKAVLRKVFPLVEHFAPSVWLIGLTKQCTLFVFSLTLFINTID